jgi:hypothetical protein
MVQLRRFEAEILNLERHYLVYLIVRDELRSK